MSRKSIDSIYLKQNLCNILNVTIDQCILDKYLKVLISFKKNNLTPNFRILVFI